MTNKLDIFKCNVCGNIVEVVLSGGGELVCCNQPMELVVPKTSVESGEKHIPGEALDIMIHDFFRK